MHDGYRGNLGGNGPSGVQAVMESCGKPRARSQEEPDSEGLLRLE